MRRSRCVHRKSGSAFARMVVTPWPSRHLACRERPSTQAGASHRPPRDTAVVPGCATRTTIAPSSPTASRGVSASANQRRGLTPAAQGIRDFATAQGIAGATVLEIGGGVGELQVELLRRGASHVTNLELSENYEVEAARFLETPR